MRLGSPKRTAGQLSTKDVPSTCPQTGGPSRHRKARPGLGTVQRAGVQLASAQEGMARSQITAPEEAPPCQYDYAAQLDGQSERITCIGSNSTPDLLSLRWSVAITLPFQLRRLQLSVKHRMLARVVPGRLCCVRRLFRGVTSAKKVLERLPRR